jgi:phage tail-like protein
MPIVNPRSNLETDPIRNFRFLATFYPHNEWTGAAADNLRASLVGFTSISGLTISTESIPYREGGYNTAVHQVPGQTSFSPLTFQRGVTLNSSSHWTWMGQLFRVLQGTGDVTGFRADIDIAVLQHPMAVESAAQFGLNQGSESDKVAMRFQVYNAWITSLAFSDLNAGDNAIMVEQMTMVHEGFDMGWAPDASSSVPALQ